MLRERAKERALSHAGVTGDEDRASGVSGDGAEVRVERGELLIAPDEIRAEDPRVVRRHDGSVSPGQWISGEGVVAQYRVDTQRLVRDLRYAEIDDDGRERQCIVAR